MDVTKQMSLARIILHCLGYALTIGGAYLLYVQAEVKHTWIIISAYVMIVFGIIAILVGFLWTICHSLKSKVYQRGAPEQQLQIFTVARPGSFPPSYEESQGAQVSSDSLPDSVAVDVQMSLAPPLYSQDGSGAPDCRWSSEPPPRYSRVEQQGHAAAEQLREETCSPH